jgi:choline dehydrogenase-like flavoprotein
VHGVDNLYIASSSVLRTSAEANPTFTALCLALRLAHHLTDAPAPETVDQSANLSVASITASRMPGSSNA